jgi:ketosteroid isomerase-like protein
MARDRMRPYRASDPLTESFQMTSSADLAIRLRRAALNRALADADLDAIGPLLARDAVLVTGTDSAILSGRKAQLLAWKREFAAPARTIYTRTPDTILVSAVEPIALEHGQWLGVISSTGQPLASGSYTAKWREVGGDWVIEAEIYLTLA